MTYSYQVYVFLCTSVPYSSKSEPVLLPVIMSLVKDALKANLHCDNEIFVKKIYPSVSIEDKSSRLSCQVAPFLMLNIQDNAPSEASISVVANTHNGSFGVWLLVLSAEVVQSHMEEEINYFNDNGIHEFIPFFIAAIMRDIDFKISDDFKFLSLSLKYIINGLVLRGDLNLPQIQDGLDIRVVQLLEVAAFSNCRNNEEISRPLLVNGILHIVDPNLFFSHQQFNHRRLFGTVFKRLQ